MVSSMQVGEPGGISVISMCIMYYMGINQIQLIDIKNTHKLIYITFQLSKN